MKKYLILLISLTLSLSLHASWSDNYRYAYYGISEGLCDEYVITTYQDSEGYLWVCTSNGLDRFDGNRFLHFTSHSRDEATRINNNFVYRVVEDRHNRIWGVTNSGLFRIDKISGDIMFPEDMGNYSAELSRTMISIRTDGSGDLIALRTNGLTYIVLDENGDIVDVTEIASDNVSNRYMDIQDEFIWVAGLSGVECFRRNLGSITPVSLDIHPLLTDIVDVSTLLVQGNYLWIGTEDGLFCYNQQDKSMRRWVHEDGNSNSISDNHVTNLTADRSGDLLIGTVKGIDHMSRDGHFQHIRSGRRGRSLSSEYVNHIFLADDGTMWVSTLVGGVNQVSPKKVMFDDMLTVEDGPSNIISCVYEDRDGNLLVGILGKGLGIRMAGSDDMKIVSLKESGMSQEDIFVICQDSVGDYWLASRNDGLLYLRRKDLGKSNFVSYDRTEEGISNKVVYDMEYDAGRNGLWVSSVQRLCFMDVATRRMTEIRVDVRHPSQVRYNDLYLDNKDRLWVAGIGLYMIDLSRNAEVYDIYNASFFSAADETDMENFDRITSIEQAPDGNIYFGTQSSGVHKVNADGTYSSINISNSEFRHRISKIVADKSGMLWMSTANGVFHYAPDSQLLTEFGENDGILSSNCYINSGHLLSDGRVAFGTSNGLLLFDRHFKPVSTHDRNVTITGIVKNEGLSLEQNIRKIDIYPSDSSFEIQFSSLDLSDANGITYSYKIDGQDDFWNLTPHGYVRYTNLKPGQYRFRVRCTNSDNSWSSKERVMEINVHPHFYQAGWFWFLLVLLVFGAIMYAIQRKMKMQKQNEMLLAQQVEEKTASLTHAMQAIIESKESIERQNILLEEQKAKLEDYSQRMENANREKLMLYTNLTHEFKTPLTLIMGPVSELSANPDNHEIAPALQIIDRNAKYLLSLVNQVLDLRRVEAGQLKIKSESFNIARLIDIYTLDYGTLLKERNITFETEMRMIHRHIISDRDIIHKMLSNLMSNAVKHTPAGGRIVMRMAQFATGGGKVYQYLSVTNSGSFISQSEYERIFECFYKIEDQPVQHTGLSSSGIGLYLVRQLVDDLGGVIRLKSSPHTGTSFRIFFPVQLVESTPIDENHTYTPPENPDTPVLLLVEDNHDMRAYIRSLLEDKFHIAEAQDGENGYELAKKIIPDFIISDLMMPGMNGLELCRKIREDNNLSHIPFLMLTALSNDTARMESYKEGVDAFLVKPFKKEMLLARIESIMSNRTSKQDELTFDLKNAYAKVDIERTDKVFLENLLSILKDNYTNPDFNVPQLQSQMCMSMTSFYKKVTALTGLTPALFIRLYRLQTAKNLLEHHSGDSGMSVSEIAYSVGFNDPKYFSKCFCNQYGVLPSAVLQGEQTK